ncbi:MAG: serine/threonine dehydratase [Bacteroidales bacterium]|nr:serine/threonine dehydratase [Bacteroidales bacterium]
MSLTLNDIQNAKRRISNLVNKTPVLSSSLLNQWLGHEIYFKTECMQKIGAFKARGACNTIAWLLETDNKPKHIIANSSGNHAQAVAWAASQFQIPSTIYMPAYSSGVKIQATLAYGANVELCDTRDIADGKTKEAANDKDVYWIPPYNHDQVIAGQGTAAYEAIEETGNIDAVFAPCGGGGLLSGTLVATRGLNPRTKIIGAEPLQANDAAESLRKGTIQKLSSVPDTLADGAMTMAIGPITFEYLKQLDDFYEVSEEKIIYWTQWLSHLLKVRIEPTSALGMDAAIQWLSKQTAKKKVLVIISGGNIDHKTELKIWKEDYLNIKPG